MSPPSPLQPDADTASPASLVVAFFDDDAGERVEMGRQPVRAFMSSKKTGEPTPAKCRDARGALSAHTPAMHPPGRHDASPITGGYDGDMSTPHKPQKYREITPTA